MRCGSMLLGVALRFFSWTAVCGKVAHPQSSQIKHLFLITKDSICMGAVVTCHDKELSEFIIWSYLIYVVLCEIS